jgi:lipoate-protein ligase A
VKPLHFIHLQNIPIFEQLQLEEALLRTDQRNFCIVNQGSPRAIVMGISGQPAALLELEKVRNNQIPVIQRFSGGGTVIVDEQTLFITFIFSKEALEIPAFPESILRWTGDLYKQAWQIPRFQLKENDYAIDEKKCGGNAQYIRKDRWLHHTSFLWDYSEENMGYLLLPAKRPAYRLNRDHGEFLTRLKGLSTSPDDLIAALKKELVKQFYIEDFKPDREKQIPHRQSTHLITV